MSLEKKDIVLIEPLCWKKMHYAFNHSMITAISSSRSLSIMGDWNYVRLFGLIGPKDSIRYREASVYELVRRYIFIFRALRRSRFKSKIFLSFDNIIFPVFVLLFSKVFSGGTSNFAIMHNNLPGLVRSKWKRWLVRVAIRKGNIVIFSLTRESQMYCQRFFSDTHSIYLPHPLYSPQTQIDQWNSIDIKPKFLFVGRQADLAVESNFFERFITILNEMTTVYSINAEVIVASAAFAEIKEVETTDRLTVRRINHYLNFDQYNSLIEDATYVVFPDSSMNKLRPSGVLIDCMSLGTPFLAPDYGHFAEFAGCGLNYSNNVDLREKINYILQTSINEYLEIKKNIKEMQQRYSLEHHRILNISI